MSSYLITGASRGLGFEFIRYLAQEPNNTVIGLVRNKSAAEAKAKEEKLDGVLFVEGQYTDLPSLKNAAEAVKKITGGSLDYLVNNAAIVSHESEYKTLGDFDDDFETLEKDIVDSLNVNLLGVIKTVHAFLPLLRNGKAKKVVTISTGMADLDLINDTEIAFASPYSISKGAVNVAMAKFHALYAKEGFTFLSISPGYVATERNLEEVSSEDTEKTGVLVAKFVQYAPHFTRPLTPVESVTAVLSVAHNASVKKGDGGKFISHLGTKQWL
ncbi:NAD(P)-binding protein [Aspergillus californicus]